MAGPVQATGADDPLQERILAAPMSSLQIIAVVLCLLLNMVDGYDVLVMPFAAPSMSKEFAISSSFLGWILSGSLIGMAIGSFFLAPFADKIGRRPLTLISLVIAVVGMLLTPFAGSAALVFVTRIIAGIGIGGMVSNLAVIVSEYSNAKHKSLATGIFTAGYPLGATFGGLLAGLLISHYGWRSAFFLGVAVTTLLLLACVAWMPESFHYLIEKGNPQSKEKLNKILVRIGQQPVDEMPKLPAHADQHNVFAEVFGTKRAQTLLMWVGYACLTASFYFANSWTPKIIEAISGSADRGVITGVLFNVGGAAGSVVFGLLALKFAPRAIQATLMVLAAVFYALFGFVLPNVGAAMGVGVAAGLVITAGVAGVYVLGPALYSTASRGTGFGWLIGVGRLVSVTAPVIVGYMRDAKIADGTIFQLSAIPLLVSAAAFVMLGVTRKRAGLDPEPTRQLAPAPANV